MNEMKDADFYHHFGLKADFDYIEFANRRCTLQ
jgi:hypothetical protein